MVFVNPFYNYPFYELSDDPRRVLGIESSCDDTGVAVVEDDGKVLSNCVHSQLRQHLSHGGIIPMIAKEYHLENIDKTAKKAFHDSRLRSVAKDIDAIAVSTRPGLNYSLQVGLNYARTLAKKYSKPLIPIHHMQAHALMPLLRHDSIKFPYIALLISGGHCLLAICKRYNEFQLLGSSQDEAPGDLLDKVARRLRLRNLGHPYDSISGGASIELLSQQSGVDRFRYFNVETAIPMLRSSSCDFSFTGYRGTFDKLVPMVDSLWEAGDRGRLLEELGHICGSLQRAILVQLFKKLQRAVYFYRMHWRHRNVDAFSSHKYRFWRNRHLDFKVRSRLSEEWDWPDVVVSGGVAANRYLIDGLREACRMDLDPAVNVYAPPREYCSDNGLMIAWNGMLRFRDFESYPEKYEKLNLNESVIEDSKKMDLVEAQADCDIGTDISLQVNHYDFRLSKLTNPELRLTPRK